MVGYYEHLAIELDSHAILSLIRIFSHGSREIPVNMHKVMHYLHVAATGNVSYFILTNSDIVTCFYPTTFF